MSAVGIGIYMCTFKFDSMQDVSFVCSIAVIIFFQENEEDRLLVSLFVSIGHPCVRRPFEPTGSEHFPPPRCLLWSFLSEPTLSCLLN